MIHLSVAELDRFVALSPNSDSEHKRLQGLVEKGVLKPEHVFVASDEGRDIGRISLVTRPDGIVMAYQWKAMISGAKAEPLHDQLVNQAVEAARTAGITELETVIVDREEEFPDDKRAAMERHRWQVDSERLMLEAEPETRPRAAEIVDVSPHDDDVVAVMALAMAESLDDYDRTQVAKLGADTAAAQYRDMMAKGASDERWLLYRGPQGPAGVAAMLDFPDELCLGYLGVDPSQRQQGIGRALTDALVARAHERGIAVASASVAVANDPIRATLARAGFGEVSRRTDFLLRLNP